jgi:hypothetical protein
MWPDDNDFGNSSTTTQTFSDPLKDFESFTEAAINPLLTPPVSTPDSSGNGSLPGLGDD